MINQTFRNNFKLIDPKKGHKKEKPPSGREWTPDERDEYYKNLSNDWTSWKNEALSIIINRKIVDLHQHRDNSTSLLKIEGYLNKCFKDGMDPRTAGESYLK